MADIIKAGGVTVVRNLLRNDRVIVTGGVVTIEPDDTKPINLNGAGTLIGNRVDIGSVKIMDTFSGNTHMS